MTELLNAEVDDDDGRRRLTRTEVLTYTNMIAGAGNETATRLIGFTTELLATHPEQRRAIVDDRDLLAPAIEEVLRYEAPSPRPGPVCREGRAGARHVIDEGSIMLLLNGSANRDERHFQTRIASTSGEPTVRISASATACTTAWVRHWPDSRAGSRSTRSCGAGRPGRSTSSGAGKPTPPACAGGKPFRSSRPDDCACEPRTWRKPWPKHPVTRT